VEATFSGVKNRKLYPIFSYFFFCAREMCRNSEKIVAWEKKKKGQKKSHREQRSARDNLSCHESKVPTAARGVH
jgi:hypothetical protein